MKAKRRRAFGGHATKWQFGMRADQPGSLVQMDHMSVSFPGASVKNFTAVCPATGHLVARAYSRATSNNTARTVAKNKTSAPQWRIINPSPRPPDVSHVLNPYNP